MSPPHTHTQSENSCGNRPCSCFDRAVVLCCVCRVLNIIFILSPMSFNSLYFLASFYWLLLTKYFSLWTIKRWTLSRVSVLCRAWAGSDKVDLWSQTSHIACTCSWAVRSLKENNNSFPKRISPCDRTRAKPGDFYQNILEPVMTLLISTRWFV